MHTEKDIARRREWLSGWLVVFVVVFMTSCRGGSVQPSQSAQARAEPVAATGSGAWLAGSNLQRFECIAPCMGMQARIVMFAADRAIAKAAGDAAIAELARLDQVLSDYRDDSETAAINRSAGGEPVHVSESFLDVLRAAMDCSQRSDGAFDITIGPVSQLWRTARSESRTPTPEEIAAAQRLVDWRDVQIDEAASTVRLARPGMRLDFGGIGKGFAVDRAFDVLHSHGVRCALVSIAGDIRLGEPPPGRKGWRIVIDDGITDSTPVIELTSCGVSTSGDAEQVLILDGQRHSHIIRPGEGLGLTDRRAVTVISRDATTSDAWATALSVLSPERGKAITNATPGVAMRIVNVRDDQIVISTTANFEAHLVQPATPAR